jgi:hypothetical protein
MSPPVTKLRHFLLYLATKKSCFQTKTVKNNNNKTQIYSVRGSNERYNYTVILIKKYLKILWDYSWEYPKFYFLEMFLRAAHWPVAQEP